MIVEKFDFQHLLQPMFEISMLNKFVELGIPLPDLTQRMKSFERELKQKGEQPPSIVLTPSDLEKTEVKELMKVLEKDEAEVYLLDEFGNTYNLRRCVLCNEELPDELAEKLLNSPLFEYVEKLWRENESKSVEEELNYAFAKVLFEVDKERAAERVADYFKKKGKLNELNEYLKEKSKEIDFHLHKKYVDVSRGQELKRRKVEEELQRLQLQERILKKLLYARIRGKRILGIIPQKTIELHLGYEEFFHNHLGAYSKGEIYSVIKELEKDLQEINKNKIKALKKEFKKREGISRKKKVALALLGLVGASICYALYNYYSRDRTPPEIHSINYKFLQPDSIFLSVNASDPSGIKEVLVEIQGKNYSLPLVNGLYSANIVDGKIYDIENLPIKIYAFDRFNNCETKYLAAVPNLKEKFLSLAIVNQVPQEKAENFYSKYLELVKQLYPENKSLLISPLKLYSENSTIFEELYRSISSDPRITIERSELLSFASQLFLDLGYTGKVRVLSLGTGNYTEEFLSLPTIQAFGNYSIAIYQLNLPKHDRDTLFLLGNATQMDPEIVDFSPIRFRSVDLTDVYLIPIPSRETWITAEILKRIKESGFNILGHPEMLLGLNGKVIANAWCIFNDSPYYSIAGIEKKINNRVIKVSDEDVLNLMMLQWDLYSQFSPQRNGSNLLYNRDFPWYNSSELKALYPDKNELRVALFNLFYLPSATYSMKEGKRVFGIKAGETSLLEAKKEYETISSLYPSGKIGKWSEDPRDYYYGWLGDRAGNGLNNTVAQYLGIDPGLVFRVKNWVEWLREVKDNNGIDGYLTRNWKYWDLVKFIVGYERWNPKGGAHEIEGIAYIIPETLRMFGFPTDLTIISPAPLGAGGSEWSISLPYPIVESMEKNFPDSNILIGPGYTFGLYSCGDGLIKERGIDDLHKPIENGITKVFKWIGEKRVYLMKRD